MPLETLVGYSIIAVFRDFLGFYAAWISQSAASPFKFLNLPANPLLANLKMEVGGLKKLKKKKKEIKTGGKIFKSCFRSEQDKRKKDLHSPGVPGICG